MRAQVFLLVEDLNHVHPPHLSGRVCYLAEEFFCSLHPGIGEGLAFSTYDKRLKAP